jgi:hypothetical protein
MSLFGGCDHKWRNYGRAAGGSQQQVCGRCGKIRNSRAGTGLFHTHSYPVGRRGSVVECACGHQKRVG